LVIEGVTGPQKIKVKTQERLSQKVDLAIFSCKTNDLEGLIEDNRSALNEAVIVSTQNGLCADKLLKQYFAPEKIITGIVMFGATFYPPNLVVHNFPGELVIGSMFAAPLDKLSAYVDILRKAFRVSVCPNIKGAKHLKIFANLNNCIPALLGKSMQETFIDMDLAQLAILLNREAYAVMQKAGVVLEDLPGYPKSRLESMVQMPTGEAAAVLSKIMTGLSKEPLYGSVLQSIQRGKKSEIDYINGEVVSIAEKSGTSEPLNEKIVELVHDVEDAGRFFDKKELLATLEGAI